jgi:glutaminyl-tRNA synthetase
MAVLNPLKVVIENYPEGRSSGCRRRITRIESSAAQIPFSRELLHRRDDFMENPPPQVSSAWRPAAKCACATAM